MITIAKIGFFAREVIFVVGYLIFYLFFFLFQLLFSVFILLVVFLSKCFIVLVFLF